MSIIALNHALNEALTHCTRKVNMKGIPFIGPTLQRRRWGVIGTTLRLIVAIPIFLLFTVLCTSPRTKTTAFVPHYKTVPLPTPYGYK